MSRAGAGIREWSSEPCSLLHPEEERHQHQPEQGVFSTRSQDRPNPIGLHRVKIVAIDANRIHVRDLEAINGTPILDVKPVLDRLDR